MHFPTNIYNAYNINLRIQISVNMSI